MKDPMDEIMKAVKEAEDAMRIRQADLRDLKNEVGMDDHYYARERELRELYGDKLEVSMSFIKKQLSDAGLKLEGMANISLLVPESIREHHCALVDAWCRSLMLRFRKTVMELDKKESDGNGEKDKEKNSK